MNSFLRILYGISLIIPWCYRCHTLGRFRPQGPSTIEVSVVASEMAKEKETTCARFLEQVPLQVFAIACVFVLEGQARDAAKKAVQKKPITNLPHSPELDKLCASSYHRLISLSETNIQQASGLANRQDSRPQSSERLLALESEITQGGAVGRRRQVARMQLPCSICARTHPCYDQFFGNWEYIRVSICYVM